MPESPSRAERRPGGRALIQAENLFSVLLLALVTLLSCWAIACRALGIAGIRGSADYIQHSVLWIAFAGGALASRDGRHLSLTYGFDRLGETVRQWVKVATSFVDTLILTALTLAGLSFSLLGFDSGAKAGVIPVWVLSLAMPAGFLAMTARAVAGSSDRPARRLVAALGVLPGLAFGLEPLSHMLGLWQPAAPVIATVQAAVAPALSALHLPLLVILVVSALMGTPVFVLLGGLAVFFFAHSGGSIETIPNEAYAMLSGPIIPAIPLFTLAGFIISESKAGERLVRLFRALFGWLPGGPVVMSILICAFLTTFTGASGVTILAVGGLLYYILTQGGYEKRFSTGLLTASGSIGLLFPPSLPIILYGVVAQVSIKDMFVGGVLPGAFMVLTLAGMGIVESSRKKIPRTPFHLREAFAAFGGSIWEVILPFLILVLFLKGIMTLVETAAFSVLYAFVVEVVGHRDIRIRDVPAVFTKSALVMGGVLVILSVAKGLSYYTVDAEIPMRLMAWMQATVSSRFVFLILLNVALLIVGCFMDIFSAITVVVPLIVPLGVAYGVNPVHLGIIFLANLELGYLTPPVGMNLFLASYRFEEPLGKIYQHVMPFLLVLLAAVLVITYVPWLTTGLLSILHF